VNDAVPTDPTTSNHPRRKEAKTMKQMWSQLTLLFLAITAAVMATVPSRRSTGDRVNERDRGAVSLEQVLWFVAAGVAVAVIAGIVWTKIKNQANTDPVVPAGP
jgi:cytochrome bd-type quinol oxidase subunit 2